MSSIKIQKLTENFVFDVAKMELEIFGSSDEKKIRDTISSENLSYYLLIIDGELVGFLECLILSPEAEIYDIAISDKFRGKGYSKLFMKFFFNLCKENQVETIFLEVNSINYVAKNLYTSFGFKEYSVRKNYYGKYDAILMKCELS